MIRFLRGIFHPSSDGSAIIETDSGVGFRINIPANSGLYKNVDGDEVSVYTSMQVREDAVNLYGFTSMEDLELFELLITVNGVGAKAGLSVMSALAPAQLRMAITSGDAASITKANGIGKKTAEKLILNTLGSRKKDSAPVIRRRNWKNIKKPFTIKSPYIKNTEQNYYSPSPNLPTDGP